MKKITLVYPEKIDTIAPEIYGHFTEHIGGVIYDGIWVGKDSKIPNVHGFRKEIIDKLKAINPPVIRWPGGCFAETYHWYDGVGENRPIRPSFWTSRNQGRTESNEVGTHEFVDFCELVDAKPYFAVGVTSTTPMEARDWMDYCLSPRGSTTLALEREKNGHPEPFSIPYWGIGNENWGEGGNMTAQTYGMEYRKFGMVMGNLVKDKPGYKFFAGGADSRRYEWTRGLLETLKGTMAPLDGMSVHFYCNNSNNPFHYGSEEWYLMLNRGAVMEDLIQRHYAVAQGYCMEDKAKLVVDEWGCWYLEGDTGPSHGYNLYEQQSTMRDAIYAAMTLNIFNNHCDKVQMANIAQLCNNIQSLFLANGEHCITTPTYHVFDLYKTHQGGTAIRVLVEDNAEMNQKISTSASIKDGILTITLVNCSYENDIDVDLKMLGATVEPIANGQLLWCEDPHTYNSFENPDAVKPQNIAVNILKPIKMHAASILSLQAKIKEE